ncbi:MAG: flagellar biosynthesis protein FlhF [Lachnospiraceae bacterium]|nr:flagellar biosynthesis protein FlhF [Lachnospiraceae bacterium]
MIIKKFTGKTEEDAVEAAKKELGSGVVIMNVKSVKRKGLAGLFGARQMEVTAALEEESEVQQKVQKSIVRTAARTGTGENIITAQTAVDVMNESSQNIEKKLDSLQQLLMNRFQQSEAEIREMQGAEVQETEGKSTVEEIPEEREETSEQERFIKLLYNTMLESEVDEKYANQIVDDFDRASKPDLPIDYILSDVYQKMILKFGRAEGITPAENIPRIVLFMGPTGVGKTTTIAKIASGFTVGEKKQVALLTADTYRIAAVEQLRTYANILEVPFRVIYTAEEAQEAIREFQGFDYIFMDTAGHSHQNEEQLENMRKLYQTVQEAGECQTFLVLSATTKYRDLMRIVSSYKGIADYQLIFTKLDETATWGNLLNLKLYTDTPIAFVTYGQNVPNDIEQFNPQKVVKQILSTKTL